ncbi:hypothetical protein TNCV_3365341 [Trichonephila clavipes]|nr:hypothetical protein TNCV_3365341 [Trichonephila clavipes]
MSDTNDFNSLHNIDTVKGHAFSYPIACGFVCVRFTLPSPHSIGSVKGHAVAAVASGIGMEAENTSSVHVSSPIKPHTLKISEERSGDRGGH